MPKKFNTVEERRAYWNEWHARNKHREDYKMSQAETKKRIRKDLRVWYQDLKKDYQCSRCGIADYRVLDFHHKDPLDKDTEVGNMVRMRVSRKKILAEIAKCDCLCANCHRIVHWEERLNE
jgi:hypothetical protein